MGKSQILQQSGIESYEDVREKIRVGMRCGKSPDYFRRLLQEGCPNGRKHCNKCSLMRNGGKSEGKGKGKNKHALASNPLAW